jgi:hypothetical protein
MAGCSPLLPLETFRFDVLGGHMLQANVCRRRSQDVE